MTKTELYDLAQITGRTLAAETDELKLQTAIVQAATANNVAGPDLGQFTQFVQAAKHTFFVLGTQKLPSETLAAQAAKNKPAAPVAEPPPTPAS